LGTKKLAKKVAIQVSHYGVAIPGSGDVSLFPVERNTVDNDGTLLPQIVAQATGSHAQVQQCFSWPNQLGNDRQGIVATSVHGAPIKM
jgi:hypothetical protein